MIYFLRGTLEYYDINTAVLDVGGVGYRCTVSQNTLGKIAGLTGEIKLYTHMAVREDNVELFGFFDEEELNAFKLLITVSGVGPKAAMAILSQLSPDKLAYCVQNEDSKSISRAQGVGAKTAARVVLELKDKMNEFSAVDTEEVAKEQKKEIKSKEKYGEAMDALTVLGYTRSAAAAALSEIDIDNTEVEKIIRLALARLMK